MDLTSKNYTESEISTMNTDKRLNEIIRVKKSLKNFVTMDKSFLEDSRLSFKAKGILAYLLSKPDNWKVIVGHLVNVSTDGKSAVYAGLKELKEYGYYEKVPIRNEQGTRIIRWESTVYEVPHSLFSDFQEVDEEEIENQLIENEECNNNYNTNKSDINYNQVQSCQEKQIKESMEKEETTLEMTESLIKTNICYEDLKVSHASEIALIDEFVSIMVDAILSKGAYVRINGEEKPRSLVKRAIMKVGYFHIEQVLWQFQAYEKRIKKKRNYVLSMLYHSSMELETGMENEMRVDI